jgi:hypothetical protein
MPKPVTASEPRRRDLLDRVVDAMLNFLSQIPATGETRSVEPVDRARAVARAAAVKAAVTSGSLALPAGPLGWFTLLPDLVGIWKIQAQMVADIAGAFGKQAYLTREQMLYCLFRHAAAQVVRDLVTRVGGRVLIRRASLSALEAIARRIGVRITQRTLGKGVSRWVPVVGALGMAGYAYYDTGQVANTAIDLFGQEIVVEPEHADDGSGTEPSA